MTRRKLAGIAIALAGVALGMGAPPAANAHLSCSVSPHLLVSGANLLDSRGHVSFGGDGRCDVAHYTFIQADLYRDGSRVTFATNDTNFGIVSVREDWSPAPWCDPTDNLGESHAYRVNVTLIVSNPGGGWEGHPIGGYKASTTGTMTCSLL